MNVKSIMFTALAVIVGFIIYDKFIKSMISPFEGYAVNAFDEGGFNASAKYDRALQGGLNAREVPTYSETLKAA